MERIPSGNNILNLSNNILILKFSANEVVSLSSSLVFIATNPCKKGNFHEAVSEKE